jgi:hypothetical protein
MSAPLLERGTDTHEVRLDADDGGHAELAEDREAEFLSLGALTCTSSTRVGCPIFLFRLARDARDKNVSAPANAAFRTLGMANAGPIPMRFGSTPTTVVMQNLPRIGRPSS